MTKDEILNRPLVEWTIELQDDIKKLDRSKIYKRQYRNLIRSIIQIRGYLTEDGLGLVINPQEDLVEGYYIVSSEAFTDIDLLKDLNEREIHNELYGCFATLVYKKSMEDKAEFVGVFDPEDNQQWKEVAINDTTSPATFRFPKHILEEYRTGCNEKEQSLTDALVGQMWNTIRHYRYGLMNADTINILGNGEEWDFISDEGILTFFTSPLAEKREVEK
ncbi:hypothetical protein [Methanocalculus sp. MC3]